jgi:hypothetical protein
VKRSKKPKRKNAIFPKQIAPSSANPPVQPNQIRNEKHKLFRDLNFWFGAVGVVGTIIGIVGFWYYLKDTNEAGLNKNKTAMSGIMRTNEVSDPIVFSAGGLRLVSFDPGGAIFNDGSETILWVRHENHKVLVSLKMKNDRGELIAELRNNEWQLNKDLIFDRNYTDYAIEVRERSGKVVLQVANLGETLYLAGVFRCSSGRTLTIAEGVWDSMPSRTTIAPIFDYPSDQHFGSCPGYADLLKREPVITNGQLHASIITKPLNICP